MTEPTEALQRTGTGNVFDAGRESNISLNYEENDIEGAASIFSEDHSVTLDVDSIILRSKVYWKYHPERYKRMIRNFLDRTSSASTLKTLGPAQHVRHKSCDRDTIIAQNISVPFPGMSFLGEATPTLDSDSDSENEAQAL